MTKETATKLLRLALGLAVMLLAGLAIAAANGVPLPGVGDLDPDFRAWFSSPAALAGTVAVVVGYLKTWLKLEGDKVRLLGLVVGVAFAAVGAAIGELDRNVINVIIFGVMAGIAAGGGWDILSGLVAVVAKVFGVFVVGSDGEAKRLPSSTATAVTPVKTVVIERDEKSPAVSVEVRSAQPDARPGDDEGGTA